MDAEARRQAIHQLIKEWLAFPDHRATDFTTLEARIDRFVADAVARAVKDLQAEHDTQKIDGGHDPCWRRPAHHHEGVPMDEKLAGVKELEDRFGPPVTWWYAKAEQGAVPSYRLGKYRRFKISEIEAWLADQRRGPKAR